MNEARWMNDSECERRQFQKIEDAVILNLGETPAFRFPQFMRTAAMTSDARKSLFRSVFLAALLTISSLSMIVQAAPIPIIESETFSADRDTSMLATSCCGGFNNVNGGLATTLQAGTAGSGGPAGETRALISFDVSSLAGKYDTIQSIQLKMYKESVSNISSVSPFTVEFHEISAANGNWLEGTGGNDESTWDNKDENNGVSSIPWASGLGGLTTPTTDYDTTILASNTFTTGGSFPADNTAVDFDFLGTSSALTALIDGWTVSNPGMVMFASIVPGSANQRMRFHSTEETTSGTSAYIPQLIVTYSVPVPEPSSLLLLGFGVLGMVQYRRKRRIAA